MKTARTSSRSTTRGTPGRCGWSRDLISCFLDRKQNAVAPFFDWFAGEARERERKRKKERKGYIVKGGKRKSEGSRERERVRKEGGQIETGRKPNVPCCLHSYSYCRFKCLLITRLVQQPPRSRSLYIFISTSRPSRFRE